MTTGLALDHLYRQYGQAPSNPAAGNNPNMNPAMSHASRGGPMKPQQQQHNGDDFVPDPLPFNYEMPVPQDMDNMGSFDDRYGRKASPYDKAPSHRYGGSLLSSMQSYSNEGPPPQYGDAHQHMASHHYAQDRRMDQHSMHMDRGHGPSKDGPYGAYVQHAQHGHADHDARYEMNSHMMSAPPQSNMHAMYPPSSYGGMPQHPGATSQQHPSFSSMMDHHASTVGPAPTAPKKEAYHNDYMDRQSSSVLGHLNAPSGPVVAAGAQSQNQEAVIKVKTSLKNKYWRNGRRNLQCFPACKVFGDYSSIKIEDLKQHDFMWGKCRGSLIAEVTLNSNATFDDILLLGRVHSLENIPVPFEEAVLRECMIGRVVEPDVMDVIKEQWIPGERLPDFINQNTNLACYEFKPKVWKYTDDMMHGKCKRRNVRYYVQFEAFVPVLTGDRRCYVCIGSGMSSSFEVGSSRVLARQKRKATARDGEAAESDEDKEGAAADNGAYMQDMSGRPTKMAKPTTNANNSQGTYPI